MTKYDNMKYLVRREKYERAIALLTNNPAAKLVHEHFAKAYAKRIAELNSPDQQT